MIKFICDNNFLEISCFNYIWLQFKDLHETVLSATQLNLLFQERILHRLSVLPGLSEDCKDYLSDFKLDDPKSVLNCNEPKRNKDFKFLDSNSSAGFDENHTFVYNLADSKIYTGYFDRSNSGTELNEVSVKIKKLKNEADELCPDKTFNSLSPIIKKVVSFQSDTSLLPNLNDYNFQNALYAKLASEEVCINSKSLMDATNILRMTF